MRSFIILFFLQQNFRKIYPFAATYTFRYLHSLRFTAIQSIATNDVGRDQDTELLVVVDGQVQGPFYRATCKHEAFFNRNLTGFVKERIDGTTEILVQGKKSKLESFVRWCRKGPGLNQIAKVQEVTWRNVSIPFLGFEAYPSSMTKSFNNLQELSIIVTGQVHGPYYRTICKNEVNFHRKLGGCLKERENGESEIIVQGERSKLESFLRWCKKGRGLSQQVSVKEYSFRNISVPLIGFEVYTIPEI